MEDDTSFQQLDFPVRPAVGACSWQSRCFKAREVVRVREWIVALFFRGCTGDALAGG